MVYVQPYCVMFVSGGIFHREAVFSYVPFSNKKKQNIFVSVGGVFLYRDIMTKVVT